MRHGAAKHGRAPVGICIEPAAHGQNIQQNPKRLVLAPKCGAGHLGTPQEEVLVPSKDGTVADGLLGREDGVTVGLLKLICFFIKNVYLNCSLWRWPAGCRDVRYGALRGTVLGYLGDF